MGKRDDSDRILRLALERGLISQDDLDLAEGLPIEDGRADRPWGPEVENLVRRGVLEPSDVVRLVHEIGTEPESTTKPSEVNGGYLSDADVETLATGAEVGKRASTPLDPYLDIALDPVILSWDRYEIGDFLGQGGMGCVYRAHDPQLDRDVALKFLRRGDPDLVHRFRREARTQAQVDHQHVCRVYEVGEVGRHAYIAMQFVDGQSLMEAGLSMTLAEKVAVAATVARAVHAAHEKGLIHRDLKPANVLVERRQEGWHPYVVDFGIARAQHEHDVTESGTVMGTLSYLSPEQARGAVSELDRRSDVYGLGATMYALLAGCPPFSQNAGAEVLWQVVHEDPRSLRRRTPEIPADLDTIVMKCLEKEPGRRYQTAKDLADDLERFLRGEPIQARPASIAYRVGKRIRKHLAVSIVAVVAAVVVLVAVVANVRTVRDARLRSALDHRLAQEIKEMESSMRVAALLPLHDRSHERASIRERLAAIERETDQLGGIARGPAHFALGRGMLLLDRYSEAQEHLLAAWHGGYDDGADAYALGRAYGALYQRGLEELNEIADPELRQSRRHELERLYRDQALRFLRTASELGAEKTAYVEGLIAFYGGHHDEALAKAHEAFEQLGWLYEAKQLEGEIHLAVAQERFTRGDHSGAREAAARAGEAFAVAMDIARSDASLCESDASRWIQDMEIAIRTGGAARGPFEHAIAACDRALRINPESVVARTKMSRAHWRWADHIRDRGEDPTPHLETAVRLAEEAVGLDPSSLPAHYNLGCALSTAAVRELTLGRDPRDTFDRAIASFTQALALSPAFAPAHDDLGYAHERKGKYEIEHGLDPSQSLENAIASYREAIGLSPGLANAHNNLGIALLRRGSYEMRSGADPAASFDEALTSFHRATELNPNYAYAHANMGFVHHARALALVRRGGDPAQALEQARASFARAHEINPAIPWSYPEEAAMEQTAFRWALASGGDPSLPLRRSQRAADRALELNRHNAVAWQRAAELDLCRARLAAVQGGSASVHVRRGLERADQALRLNPDSAEAVLTRAALLVELGRGQARGDDRQRWLREARTLLDRAERLNRLLGHECDQVRTRIAEVE